MAQTLKRIQNNIATGIPVPVWRWLLRIVFVFTSMLIFSFSSFGQTTLFQFPFEANTNPTINNTPGTPAFTPSGLANTGINNTYTGCGTGSANMYRGNTMTTGDYYQFTVNTTGFFNLIFSYCDVAGGNNFNNVLVQVSPDGTTWTTVIASYAPANGTVTNRTASAFPTSCENVPLVYIQIIKSNAYTSNRYYYIDNATLTGYPIYYSQGSLNPNLTSSWNTKPAGGGSSPTNFTSANQFFVIQNGHTMTTVAGGWSVSGTNTKVEIQNGGTLTEPYAITLSVNTTLQVDNGGTLNHNVNSATIFGGTESFAATSTENYGFAGAQTVVSATYGNLTLSNSGAKTVPAGTLTVAGNLNVTGASADLSTNNASVSVSGNIIGTGNITSGSGTITIGGNWTNNGTFTSGTGTVNFNGGTAQTFTGITYNNLTMSGTGGATLQSSPLNVGGNLNVSGTLNYGSSAMTINVTGNVTGNGIVNMIGTGLVHQLNVSGNASSFNGSFNTTNSSGSTVVFNTAGSQNIFGTGTGYFQNLTISGANTKTLQGAATVNGTLSLSNGNLALGTYNLTIGTTGSISGSYDNTHMIVCNGGTGTGSLIVQSTTAAGFQMTYPVGSGTSYTPMVISSLSATLAGTQSITVNTVPSKATGASTTDLARYWNVTASGGLTGINANVNFTYINPGDVGTGGNQSIYIPALYASSAWSTPNVPSSGGVIPISSTGTNVLTGVWTAREPITTYYSYQAGDWKNASTWTTDASGTLWINPGSSIPSNTNRVVILNGRTVYTNAVDGGRTILSLTINDGGILDLKTSTGHNFGTITGQGKLRLNSNTFPGGDYTAFVAGGGGTVEYYNLNNSNISSSQLIYNNLLISNSSAGANTVYIDNSSSPTYTLNGNFELKNTGSGNLTFNFGNPTASDNLLNMTVHGNFTVDAGCSIGVNNFASNAHSFAGSTYTEPTLPVYPVHTLNIYGDFTNNGSVRFTGLPHSTVLTTLENYYILTNNASGGINYGDVQVDFMGSTNNTLTCNGITDFFRLIIEKGTDQTYSLNVNSSNTNNFALYGPNYQGGGNKTGGPDALGWGIFYKALYIHYGTLILNDNINIPSLTEGGLDFNILPTAQLWVNGANVSTTITGFNATGYGTGSYQALTLVGTLRISSGQLSTGDATGIVLNKNGTPLFQIEGTGVLDVSEFWVDPTGTNLMSYIQTGGTVNVRMMGQQQTGPMMNLAITSTVFKMSGGTLNFTNNVLYTYGGTLSYYITDIFDIESQPGNFEVTGGTVNLNLPSYATTYTANSTVPFYNLNISRNSSTTTGTTSIQWNSTGLSTGVNANLTVLNDLTIGANSTLNLGTGTINLNVGENFTIATGGTYTPGTNTTTFNGAGNQIFDIEGTLASLNNLTMSGTSSLTLNNASAATPIVVNGNFTIGSGCTLIDNGRILQLNGSTGTTIYNAGTHFMPASGAGSIQLTGTTAQTISGDGNGSFNNLTLNKTGGSVTMTSAMKVTGILRLAGTAANAAQRWSTLNIGSNNLTLDSSAIVYSNMATGTSFSNYQMIQTTGLMSDNGVSKNYKNTTAFLFPFGIYNTSNTTYYYLPATIQFSSAPTKYGTVTTRPVNSRHYLAQSTNSLACYWHTASTNFNGIPVSSVKHQYNYNTYFIGGTESLYLPGVYRGGSTWSYINDPTKINLGNHTFVYDTAYVADGDYTAGQLTTFTSVPVLYSVADGNWNSSATWSATRGGAGGAGTPSSGTIVNIVDNHKVTTTATANAGSLLIETGSTLDLGTITGHNFAALPQKGVTGRGTLRIASNNYFPIGDFGDFIGSNGGTVEYYTTTANITIPTTSASGLALSTYYNLKLSPAGYNIILPAENLTVYNNMTVNGTGTTYMVQTPATPWTYIIDDSLNIVSGVLQFTNSVAHTIQVNGNTNISSGAIFNTGAGTTYNLNLYGNLTNNGTFDMNPSGHAQVTFMGTTNDSIKGTSSGTSYRFYNLIINKGSNSTPVVFLQSNIVTGSTNPFLTLSNGTFRVDNSALNVTITTTSAFTIPTTACLSVHRGTATVGSGSAGELLLSGKLEVLGGILNIGSLANNNNDIEYSAAGTPQIYVDSGTLNVYGQIRRGLSTTSGALQYSQRSGNVIIYGNDQTTRGKIEIVNDNSSFYMSGGKLLVANSGTTTPYDDLYLRPDTSSVTGGTIQVANSASSQTFTISSTASLWNVMVGDGTQNQNLSLDVLPMTIQDSLVINGNSQFLANDNDVNIGVNLTNNNSNAGTGTNVGGYQAGINSTSTQITTFNGTSGSINGNGSNVTNFANLVFAQSGIVTLASNSTLQVNTDLTLNTGTLVDGGNTITVIGNVDNNATHMSVSTSGGISFSGSSQQVISGSGAGVFGNVILNNGNGVDMIDNSTINGQLSFNRDVLFYIDDYTLTLGSAATITGAPFSSSRMILLNGVLSDEGVKKYFPSGASTFTYPIGVPAKYTPVVYNFTANASSNAYILVKPINSLHKSVKVTPTDYIPYYWSVITSGLTTYTVTHQYYYVASDIIGTEASFIPQRYDVPTNTWNNLVPGASINTTSHYINVPNISSDLDGEYTAGDVSGSIYTPQPMLYSIGDGNWNSTTEWSLTSGGGSCTCYPIGNPVTISSGNTVSLAANSANAYSVLISGTLDCGLTTFHDLGHVTGSGRLKVSATTDGMFVFPGGEYDGFFANTSSILEFAGTNDGTLPLKPGNIYKPFNNVEFTNTGITYMSAENMQVNNYLHIFSGATLTNILYNKDIYILGNWINSTNPSTFNPGTGMVTFNGTGTQTFSAAGTENFYDLTINNTNTAGLVMTSGATGANVSDLLYLTKGIITTDATHALTVTNTSTSAIIGGSVNSFVNGPLSKSIISGQSFVFPIGSTTGSNRYGQLSLNNTSTASSPATWSATYYNTGPSYQTNLVSPLTSVSNNEYWTVTRPAGTGTARVKLRWDASSGVVASSTTVAQLNTSNNWTQLLSTASGSTTGTCTTNANVSSDNYTFTLAAVGVTAYISGSPSPSTICNNGAIASIPVTLTGNSPWTLTYSDGTNTYSQSGIMSSSYTIQLTGTNLGFSGTSPITYSNIHLVSVIGNGISGSVNTTPVSVTVNPTFTPSITGTFTVGESESRSYTTSSVDAGASYACCLERDSRRYTNCISIKSLYYNNYIYSWDLSIASFRNYNIIGLYCYRFKNSYNSKHTFAFNYSNNGKCLPGQYYYIFNTGCRNTYLYLDGYRRYIYRTNSCKWK